MRRSGKTTRTVDNAIQILFKYGVIYIPVYEGQKSDELILADPSQIIIDDDADYVSFKRVQQDLYSRILDRLFREHLNYFIFVRSEGIIKLRK